MNPDIAYVLSHGFAARMIMHSDVLPELRRRGLRTTLILPGSDEADLAAEAARHAVALEEAPPISAWHRGEYQRMRRYLFEDVAGNPALWARHLRTLAEPEGLKGYLRPRLYGRMNRASLRYPRFRRLLERLERRTLANPAADALLARLRPRLVVATYPVDPLDAAVLAAACRADIPTVGHLLSWDNITTKGRFPVVPDHFLAWGPIMADELATYYGIAPDHIREVGVPHFDAHVTAPTPDGIAALVRGLGLDPARPYLFFGMSAPFFCPHEIDVVAWLTGAVKAGDFGEGMQLVVRPHPQNVQGHLADASWLPRIAALAGENVAIDYPALAEGGLRWQMKATDLPHLAGLLAGCAVALNSGSTLSIDALLHDKPVVLTAFDAGHVLPWWSSARRVCDFPHLQKMIALGGVRVVETFGELRAALLAALADPDHDADARARTRYAECGPADGEASARVAEALADLAAHAPAEALS